MEERTLKIFFAKWEKFSKSNRVEVVGKIEEKEEQNCKMGKQPCWGGGKSDFSEATTPPSHDALLPDEMKTNEKFLLFFKETGDFYSFLKGFK